MASLIAPRTLVRYRASTAAFSNFCSIAGYSKPHTATELDLHLSCISLMLYVCISLAVNDCHWHGAKMNSQNEQTPCRSIFVCHGRRCAHSTHIARRIVTFARFSRSLENHRNHLHPSFALHLPTTVWARTARAATDIVRTTPATYRDNHGPTGPCVCLGRDTQTPAR